MPMGRWAEAHCAWGQWGVGQALHTPPARSIGLSKVQAERGVQAPPIRPAELALRGALRGAALWPEGASGGRTDQGLALRAGNTGVLTPAHRSE